MRLPGDLQGAAVTEIVLTDEQREAVGWAGGSSLLLSANAGSGKTSVLTERFARAVLVDGVAPSRVLTITFTERAAGELRRRVRERLLSAGARDAARDCEGAMIATIHGFCAHVLRGAPLAAGVDPRFAVLDEATAAALRAQAFRGALAALLDDVGADAVDLVAAAGVDRLEQEVLEVYDGLRSRGVLAPSLPPARPREALEPAVERLRAAAGAFAAELGACPRPGARVSGALAVLERWPGVVASRAELCGLQIGRSAGPLTSEAADEYERARVRCLHAWDDAAAGEALPLLDRLLRGFGERYFAAKQARGGLDFDDLELRARELLLGDEEVRRRWSERFELIMVDELQDTNARQMDMIEALERDNALLVGDEFQSIYGFRHADVEIFRRRRDGGGEARVLSMNFRSRGGVIDAVNAVFAARFGGFVALAAGRSGGGGEVELLVTDSEGWDGADLGDTLGEGPAWRRAEARLLAARIAELIAAGEARAGEVAILLRAATDADVYRQALADVGVAAEAAPSGGFWERQEVADLVAYLGALANPRDAVALCGAMCSPLGGVSAEALVLLARAGGVLEGDVAALGEEDRERVVLFRARLARHRAAAAVLRADELVSLVVRSTGYEAYLRGLAGGAERLAAVRRVGRLGRELELREGRDLRRFADRAAQRALAGAGEADGQPGEGEADAVRLLTIHAAKGLEFPVVCVADLGRQPRLSRPMILTDGERLGVRLRGLDGGEPLEAFAYEELIAERRAADEREEERIAYVALTRARERLIVSGAAKVAGWPRPSAASSPLSWLGPALVPGIEELLGEGEAVRELDLGGHRVRLVRSSAGDGPLAGAAAPVELPAPPGPAPLGEAEPAGAHPHVQAPASLSYTALSAHASCGYGYYLRRVLGMPDVDPPAGAGDGARGARGFDAAARGRVVHAVLERLDFGLPAVPGRDALAAMVRAEGGEPRGAVLADLEELVGGFAASQLCARLARAGGARRERGFALVLNATMPLLTGVLDVIAHEEDGLALVVDYKSDRLAGADPAAVVARAYATQRDAYALAALRGGAERVEVAYCFLEQPERVVAERFAAQDVPALEERLRERAGELLAGRFEVAGEPCLELCGTCPGRARLCSWEQERTEAPAGG